MEHLSLTPEQSAEVAAGNRALLALSRHLNAQRIAAHEVAAERAARFDVDQTDHAKNLLAAAFAKHNMRRFSGDAVTNFGGL